MIKLLLAVLVLAFVAFGVYFKWVFSESLYFDKASLKYRLLVADAIKQAPVYGENPRYHYTAGDGSRPGGSSVFFSTSDTRDEILERYRDYYSKRGGEVVEESSGLRIEMPRGGNELRLNIRDNGHKRDVEIMRFRR